jgi:hypothetical protein
MLVVAALSPLLAVAHRVARYASHVFDAYDPWLVNNEIEALLNRLPR